MPFQTPGNRKSAFRIGPIRPIGPMGCGIARESVLLSGSRNRPRRRNAHRKPALRRSLSAGSRIHRRSPAAQARQFRGHGSAQRPSCFAALQNGAPWRRGFRKRTLASGEITPTRRGIQSKEANSALGPRIFEMHNILPTPTFCFTFAK